jgi:DNA-binding transcriptional LysR family regulator
VVDQVEVAAIAHQELHRETSRLPVGTVSGYLSTFGTPNSPQALSDHKQVRFSWSSTDDAMPLIGPAGPVMVPVQTSFLANNTFVLTKALVAGCGLGGAQLPQIQAELAAGTLVRILPDYNYAPLDVHAVYPTSQFLPARVRAFIEHLRTSLAAII